MHLASGDCAQPDQRRFGHGPMGRDCVTKVEQRLRRQQRQQDGDRECEDPRRDEATLLLFLPRKTRRVVERRIGGSLRLLGCELGLVRRRAGLLGVVHDRLQRLRTAQRDRRRSVHEFVDRELFARLRSERNQRGDTVEYGMAMAASHLAGAHRQLLLRDAKNRLASRTPREFPVSHDHASGCPPMQPIRPPCPRRRV